MTHAIHEVRQCLYRGGYCLDLEFEDGGRQVVDLEPVLRGEVFGPLLDVELFRQVRVDPESRTIVWPNGADFDPATLHDWPGLCAELAERARGWAELPPRRLAG